MQKTRWFVTQAVILGELTSDIIKADVLSGLGKKLRYWEVGGRIASCSERPYSKGSLQLCGSVRRSGGRRPSRHGQSRRVVCSRCPASTHACHRDESLDRGSLDETRMIHCGVDSHSVVVVPQS
ncbi:hypothetical protein RRG08_007778 [Elysia crispata]|uniref:Uncharacterized protein n=1 Tax=Elysia crispata TaxID=231223 RepID=A0AAE1B471_9GAST|nr:hypothetical protein RRG08_007778 [Elysia crispata]